MTDINEKTVNTLVTDALKLLGLYTEDRTPPSRFINEGIDILNEIIDGFERQNVLIPYNEDFTFPCTIGKSTYSIGPDTGNDIIHSKPCYMSYVYLILNHVRFPMRRMMDSDYLERFTVDNVTGRPVWWNYQRSDHSTTLLVYPCPSDSYTIGIKGKFKMRSWESNDLLTGLDPSYYKFLKHAIARELTKYYKNTIWDEILEKDYEEMKALFTASTDNDFNMKLLAPKFMYESYRLVNP